MIILFNSEQFSSAVKCQQFLGWLIMSSHLNGLTTSPFFPDYGPLSSINPRLGFWHRKCKVRANWSICILIDSCHTIFYAFSSFSLPVKYFNKSKAEDLFFIPTSEVIISITTITVADPRFPRRRAPKPAWKWKKLDQRGSVHGLNI